MLYLRELCGQVFASLLRNKLRTLLTMAGIAWGIASIVLIVAMGDGFKEGQRNNMKGLGENIVILFGGQTEMQAGGQRAGRWIHLRYNDVEAIRQRMLPGRIRRGGDVESPLVPPAPTTAALSTRTRSNPTSTSCATFPSRRAVSSPTATKREARRVAILGPKVKEQLFGKRQNVVGAEHRDQFPAVPGHRPDGG